MVCVRPGRKPRPVFSQRGSNYKIISGQTLDIVDTILERVYNSGMHQMISQNFLVFQQLTERKGLLLWLASEVFTKFSCVFLQFIEKVPLTTLYRLASKVFLCASVIYR